MLHGKGDGAKFSNNLYKFFAYVTKLVRTYPHVVETGELQWPHYF